MYLVRRLFGYILLLSCCQMAMAQQQIPTEWGHIVKYQPSESVRVVKDLVYVKYNERELRLDLYLPKKAIGLIPVIVVIRGGAWRMGDKDEYARFASHLAEAGFAAACIEYRTLQEATYPAAVKDTKAAVRWLRSSAKKYGINGDAIGAIGGSAGGHLVMMLATTHKIKKFQNSDINSDISSRVQAVVVMAPVTDFISLAQQMVANGEEIEDAPFTEFIGVSFKSDPELWKEASPITHVDSESAPVLLLHSIADPLVPYQQSMIILEKYNELKLHAECHLFSNAPHSFFNYSAWYHTTVTMAITFFRDTLTNHIN